MAIVSELMTPQPVKVRSDTPVADCARILWRLGVRHLPVVDHEGRLAGVVSDFDVLQHGEIVNEDGTWADRGRATSVAGDLVHAVSVECREGDDLIEVLRELHEHGTDVAVVVDMRRHPVGILTEHDAVRWARLLLTEGLTLLPSPQPLHTVDLHAPAMAAFDLMVEHGVRHALVTDDGVAVAVVSWRDLVIDDLVGLQRVAMHDLVSAGRLLTLPAGSSLRAAADLMVHARIGLVPLVDENGRVELVISRSDIVSTALQRAATLD